MPLPPPESHVDFEVVRLEEVAGSHAHPEYIFVMEDVCINLASRIAMKYLPNAKTINVTKDDSERIYQAFMEHLTDLKQFYESLIDEESRKTFYGFWLGRITNRLSYVHHSNCLHYLLTGFIPERGSVVIQAGASDGGTASIFADMGYKVYAFEMDKANFERTKKIAEDKNFVLENFGLGASAGEVRYDSMIIRPEGKNVSRVIALDAYVREKKLASVDFIELDVEGAEMDILKGAVVTIARHKPILAISAYHKPDDFWVIMGFIKSIRPDYEFALQQGIMRPETDPMFFEGIEHLYHIPGLIDEIERKNFDECVLFAR